MAKQQQEKVNTERVERVTGLLNTIESNLWEVARECEEARRAGEYMAGFAAAIGRSSSYVTKVCKVWRTFSQPSKRYKTLDFNDHMALAYVDAEDRDEFISDAEMQGVKPATLTRRKQQDAKANKEFQMGVEMGRQERATRSAKGATAYDRAEGARKTAVSFFKSANNLFMQAIDEGLVDDMRAEKWAKANDRFAGVIYGSADAAREHMRRHVAADDTVADAN